MNQTHTTNPKDHAMSTPNYNRVIAALERAKREAIAADTAEAPVLCAELFADLLDYHDPGLDAGIHAMCMQVPPHRRAEILALFTRYLGV
jgi:hypothetical protein